MTQLAPATELPQDREALRAAVRARLAERVRERLASRTGAGATAQTAQPPDAGPSANPFDYGPAQRLGIRPDATAPFGIAGAEPAYRGIRPAGAPDDTPDRSLPGEFGAAVARGVVGIPKSIGTAVGSFFGGPGVAQDTAGTFARAQPQPTREDLAGRAVNLVGESLPALAYGVASGAGVAEAGGSGLAAGLAGAAPFGAQSMADVAERGGSLPAQLAAGAVGTGLGAVQPLAVLGKIPGVEQAVERFGLPSVLEYVAKTAAAGGEAGAVNTGLDYATEGIARAGGADPREVDPVGSFLAGFATAAGLKGGIDLAGRGLRGVRAGPEGPLVRTKGGEVAGPAFGRDFGGLGKDNARPPAVLEGDGADGQGQPPRGLEAPQGVDVTGEARAVGEQAGVGGGHGSEGNGDVLDVPVAGGLAPGRGESVLPVQPASEALGRPPLDSTQGEQAGVGGHEGDRNRAREPWEMTRREFADRAVDRARWEGVTKSGESTTVGQLVTDPDVRRAFRIDEFPSIANITVKSEPSDFKTGAKFVQPGGRPMTDAQRRAGTPGGYIVVNEFSAPENLVHELAHAARVTLGRPMDQTAPYEQRVQEQSGSRARDYLGKRHRAAVEKALREGRPVPPEVLADYPDLKAQAAAATDSRRTSGPGETLAPTGSEPRATPATPDLTPRASSSPERQGPRTDASEPGGPVRVGPAAAERAPRTQPNSPGEVPSPDRTPGRVLSKLDEIEAAATERLRKWSKANQTTLRSGVTSEDLGALRDVAIVAGVRVARAGVKGAHAVREAVRAAIKEHAPGLDEERARAAERLATRIVKSSTTDAGAVDADRLERTFNAVLQRSGDKASQGKVTREIGKEVPEFVLKPGFKGQRGRESVAETLRNIASRGEAGIYGKVDVSDRTRLLSLAGYLQRSRQVEAGSLVTMEAGKIRPGDRWRIGPHEAEAVKREGTGLRVKITEDVAGEKYSREYVVGRSDPVPANKGSFSRPVDVRAFDAAALEREVGSPVKGVEPATVNKQFVREKTGQTPTDAKTVRPSEALAEKLSAEESAADRAWRQAVRETRQIERTDARKRLEQVRLRVGITERNRGYNTGRAEGRKEGDLRVDAAKLDAAATLASEKTKAGMIGREQGRAEGKKIERSDRKVIADVIKAHVPRELRGRFLTELRNAKADPEGVRRVMDKVEKVLAVDHGKRMMARLDKLGTPKKLRTLTEPERVAVRKLVAEGRRRLDSIEQHIGAADDMTRIADEAAGVYTTNRNNRRLKIGQEYVDREAVVETGVKAIEESRKAIRQRPGLETDPTGSRLRRVHQSMLNMDTIARTMGDHNLHRIAVDDMRDAETKVYGDTQRAEDALLGALRKHGYEPGSDRVQRLSRATAGDKAETISVELDSGQTAKMTPGEAMTLYALSGDRDARANIEKGTAITFQRNKSTGKPVELTPFDLRRITDALTPEQRGIVDDLKAYVDDKVRPGVFESHRDLRGFDLEAVPGYWRTRRNMAQSDTIGRDTILSMGEVVRKELQNLGFLKERTGGKTPYLIGDFFDDFSEIAHTSALVTHMARPIRNAELVFGDPRIHRAIASRYGVGMNDRIREHVNAAKILFREPQTAIERMLNAGSRNIARAKLAVNPKTWIKQVGAIPKVLGEFSAGEGAAGIAALGDRSARREMLASPYFRQRYDTSIYRRASPSLGERRPLLGSSSLGQLAGQVTKRPVGVLGEAIDKIPVMNWMDSLSAQVAWGAAKARGKEQGLAGADLARFTAREAERAIRDTANTSSPLDMSGVALQTRGKPLGLFLQFTSDASKSYNMIARAIDEKDVGKLAGVAANVVLAAAVGLGFRELWSLGDSPEKKAAAPGMLAKARQALTNELASIPYFTADAAKLAGGIVDLARGQQATSVADSMPDAPVGDAAVTVGEGLQSLTKALRSYLTEEGEDRRFSSGPRKGQDKVLANLKDAADKAFGGGMELFAGVPVRGVLRDFKAIANLVHGTDPADAALTEFYKARNAAPEKSPQRRRLDRFNDRVGEIRKAKEAGRLDADAAAERIKSLVQTALGPEKVAGR